MTPLLAFLGLCAGWTAKDTVALPHPHFHHARFWISPPIAEFLWQPAYGAVVPHNPTAVLAAWQSCQCYGCQTLFLPFSIRLFKKSDRLSPNSWSFHRSQKINLQREPHLRQRFCNKQVFKATRPQRENATATGRPCVQCSPQLRSQLLLSITLHVSHDQFKANLLILLYN